MVKQKELIRFLEVERNLAMSEKRKVKSAYARGYADAMSATLKYLKEH